MEPKTWNSVRHSVRFKLTLHGRRPFQRGREVQVRLLGKGYEGIGGTDRGLISSSDGT